MEKPEILLENYREIEALLRPMCKSKKDHKLVDDFINECRERDIEIQAQGMKGSYSGSVLWNYTIMKNHGWL